MRKILYPLLAGMFLFSLAAHASEKAARLKVVVTIAPLKALVEGVTKDTADITVIVPPGADPHTYEPKPSQLKELSNADVYVKLGSGLEIEKIWIGRLKGLNKKMRICDSGEGIALINSEEPEISHGTRRHREGNKDPHIWLSPANAIAMVKNIRKGLSIANPDNSDFYAVNTREYVVELAALNAELKKKLAPEREKSFIVIHPSWGYFCRDYGMKQVPMEIGGKEPTARQLVDAVSKAKKSGVRVVFVSPQFNIKSAEVLAKEIGASVVTVDPLAENYMDNLRKVADELVRSLK